LGNFGKPWKTLVPAALAFIKILISIKNLKVIKAGHEIVSQVSPVSQVCKVSQVSHVSLPKKKKN
jgi:hypothetical protein